MLKLDKLPEKWTVLQCDEVKKYLADKYDLPEILNWNYRYIGFAGVSSNNGCLGSTICGNYGEIEISFEDFERLVLNINKELEYEIC